MNEWNRKKWGTFKSIMLSCKEGVNDTEVPIFVPFTWRHLSYSYLPWLFLLLLVIIIIIITFIPYVSLLPFFANSLPCPSHRDSFKRLSLRRTQEENSWDAVTCLRENECHRERRGGCHTADRGRQTIRWKRRKMRKGTAGDALALLCEGAVHCVHKGGLTVSETFQLLCFSFFCF